MCIYTYKRTSPFQRALTAPESKYPIFKDPGPKKPFRVWLLEPESLKIGYLDLLGFDNAHPATRTPWVSCSCKLLCPPVRWLLTARGLYFWLLMFAPDVGSGPNFDTAFYVSVADSYFPDVAT